jgi:hypothetical protein
MQTSRPSLFTISAIFRAQSGLIVGGRQAMNVWSRTTETPAGGGLYSKKSPTIKLSLLLLLPVVAVLLPAGPALPPLLLLVLLLLLLLPLPVMRSAQVLLATSTAVALISIATVSRPVTSARARASRADPQPGTRATAGDGGSPGRYFVRVGRMEWCAWPVSQGVVEEVQAFSQSMEVEEEGVDSEERAAWAFLSPVEVVIDRRRPPRVDAIFFSAPCSFTEMDLEALLRLASVYLSHRPGQPGPGPSHHVLPLGTSAVPSSIDLHDLLLLAADRVPRGAVFIPLSSRDDKKGKKRRLTVDENMNSTLFTGKVSISSLPEEVLANVYFYYLFIEIFIDHSIKYFKKKKKKKIMNRC